MSTYTFDAVAEPMDLPSATIAPQRAHTKRVIPLQFWSARAVDGLCSSRSQSGARIPKSPVGFGSPAITIRPGCFVAGEHEQVTTSRV